MVGRIGLMDEIVLTDKDHGRLRHLVEASPYRTTHGALLASLGRELERGRVVPSGRVSKHVVTMRSTVEVRDLETGERDKYTLVYPEEADLDEGKISIWAPLATALLGARVGRVVRCETPRGTRRFKIEKVRYQPEAAGDLEL